MEVSVLIIVVPSSVFKIRRGPKDVGFAGRAITDYVTQDSNGLQMNKS